MGVFYVLLLLLFTLIYIYRTISGISVHIFFWGRSSIYVLDNLYGNALHVEVEGVDVAVLGVLGA